MSSIPRLSRALNELQRGYVSVLLAETRGNVTSAAKIAGRNRSEFYRLLGRLGVNPREYRARRGTPQQEASSRDRMLMLAIVQHLT